MLHLCVVIMLEVLIHLMIIEQFIYIMQNKIGKPCGGKKRKQRLKVFSRAAH